MNASLLTDSMYKYMINQTIKESVATYALPVYAPNSILEKPEDVSLTIIWGLFWETMVLNMRTQTIAYAIHKNKRRNEEETKLIQNINWLESMYQSIITEEEYRELVICKEKLDNYRKIEIHEVIVGSRAHWHEQGEKSTAYFWGLEKRKYVNKIITALRNPDNVMCTDQDEIMKSLDCHYTKMLDEQPIEHNKAKDYVDEINLKQLSDVKKQALDKPLTLDELCRALQIMHNNKTPGTDVFPIESFKVFWKELSNFFYKMVVKGFEIGNLPGAVKEDILTLLPKPYKSRNEKESYRQITLLNSRYKIIATAMANRMKDALPDILGQEETGLMPGRPLEKVFD